LKLDDRIPTGRTKKDLVPLLAKNVVQHRKKQKQPISTKERKDAAGDVLAESSAGHDNTQHMVVD